MSSWLIVFAVVAYVSLTTALPLKDNSVPEEPEHVIQKRQLEALNEFFDGRRTLSYCNDCWWLCTSLLLSLQFVSMEFPSWRENLKT